MLRSATETKSRTQINWSEPGVMVSAMIHAGLLLGTFISFSTAPDFQDTPESVAVEFVTESELAQLTRGDKSQKVIIPEAKTKASKISDDTLVKPENVDTKKEVPTPPTKPIPPSPEPSKPLPAEPPKPQPTPPAPVTPVPTPTPPPQENAEIPAPPAKPDPKFEPEKIAKLLEQKTPPPPKKTEPNFDASSIEKLLQSKEAPGKAAARATELSTKANAGAETGTAQKLTMTQRDQLAGLVRDQLARCWSPPAWVTGAEKLQPTIHISLSEQGALTNPPSVVSPSSQPAMRAMEESAIRAVQTCSPLKIPAQFRNFYSEWREMSVTFDIRTML